MLAQLLADEDALGIAPRALEYLRAHEAIVQNDVRLLQQLQRSQGEEVRIAGTCADQVHLAEAGARTCGRG